MTTGPESTRAACEMALDGLHAQRVEHAAMDESHAQRVAAAVRAEMARKNMSQTRLVAEMGKTEGAPLLSQAALSRRLTGEVPFDVLDIIAIALILDVPVDVLMGRSAA